MNMKRLLTLVAFFATVQASAQQVNPVPDYVFANRMSAGRNTVTDTAAYFSIGPRYGATRGMMPPMVVDTASFSANKRNGLLIFSVQKNKFLYWDSVGVKWAEMAGTGGTAISSGDTAAMLLPYVRHAGYGLTKSAQSFLVDTLNISTRAWRQKGIDSVVSLIPANQISGSGTSNRIVKYTGTTSVGNSQITDDGTNIGFNVASPQSLINTPATGQLQIGTSSWPTSIAGKSGARSLFGNEGLILIWNEATAAANNSASIFIGAKGGGTNGSTLVVGGAISGVSESASTNVGQLRFLTNGGSGNVERMRIFGNGRVFIGSSPSDGGYQLDINGSLRTVNGANFATTSGSVGIGTASPIQIIHAKSSTGSYLQLSRIGQGTTTSLFGGIHFGDDTTVQTASILSSADGNLVSGSLQFVTRAQAGSLLEVFRATSGQEVIIGTASDAGDYKLQVSGAIYNTGIAVLSSTTGETFVGITADAGDYKLQVGGNIYNTGSLTTGAPSGGDFKPWKLGQAATVSPTSPNRTIRVEIDGTVYYLHAKTTND
jgi:hypothetical protein